MRITPLDIRKQEFRRAMRGLDADEVYAFLSTVGDEYESVLNDNKALRERLLELDDKVQEYRKMERTLRDTLLTAERVTLEAKENARREAGLIIKEAQIEAEKALRDINSDAMNLRQEVSQLRGQRESYLGRMKVIAESLLKFIENVETDFRQEDEAFGVKDYPRSERDDRSTDENGDLFKPSTPRRSENAPRVTGIPPELRTDASSGTRGPASPDPGRIAGGTTGRERPDEDARARGEAVADDGAPDGDAEAGGDEIPPGPIAPEKESEGGSTLTDINDIIERMAEGQRELVGGRWQEPLRGAGAEPGTPPSREPEATPRQSRDERPSASRPPDVRPWDAPPAGSEAGDDGLESAPPKRPVPVGEAWEAVPEVATALERPPTELADNEIESESDTDDPSASRPPGDPGDRAANDTGVTSEMSIDEIRRELRRRLSQGDEENV